MKEVEKKKNDAKFNVMYIRDSGQYDLLAPSETSDRCETDIS